MKPDWPPSVSTLWPPDPFIPSGAPYLRTSFSGTDPAKDRSLQPEILVTKTASQPDVSVARPTPFLADFRPESRDERAARLLAAYRTVRDETERRAAPLSAEDQIIQEMPEAS